MPAWLPLNYLYNELLYLHTTHTHRHTYVQENGIYAEKPGIVVTLVGREGHNWKGTRGVFWGAVNILLLFWLHWRVQFIKIN